MEWLEVSVETDNEAAEALAEVLARYAYHGVAIEAGPEGWGSGTVTVRAYLPVDERLPANRRHIEEAVWHLGQIRRIPPPTFRRIAEENWAEAWKEKMTVLHIGQRIVIRPSWREYDPRPDDIVIRLDPGQAFGTGLHPTTQMCLLALEELLRPGDEVLDLGTGSGILAIAAAKLGARRVLAVDSDSVAAEAAQANVIANGVQAIVAVTLGSLAQTQGAYDLVVANILLNVIVAMAAEGLAQRVGVAGSLVVAGILADQEAAVQRALAADGLSVTRRWQIEDWICLALTPAG